jgi:tRNA dimethylallyltransferase
VRQPPIPILPIPILPIPILAGPTASGKTALSLELGQHFPLEIISADAMMVYRGMDVGTAKPTLLERAAVPHHLIDLVEPNTDFSVAQWVLEAENTIQDVISRGRIPLVVGGTGFYIRALKEGLPSAPPSDPEAIARLEVELAENGLDAMVAELETASPEDATRAARNPRRVLRALEILRGSGRPPKDFVPQPPRFSYRTVILMPEKTILDSRIEARTRKMLADGLIDEARGLMPYFVRDARRATSFQAIGYKQALDYLTGVFMDDGTRRDVPLEEVERRITLATRQYAKRQATWFKRESDAITVDSVDAARLELERLLEAWVS